MKDIQRKAAGNVDLGTEEWIEQYGRFVYGLAFRLTTDVQEAEDLSQETLLKAWLRDGCFLAMAGKLPLNQRAAFSLVDMFGLSIPEMAEILDVTPKAVKGLLYRARLSLESFFRDHGGILDEKNPCRCSAWIEFSNNRNALQRETRTRITVLDYRGTGYQPNEETRRQILQKSWERQRLKS